MKNLVIFLSLLTSLTSCYVGYQSVTPNQQFITYNNPGSKPQRNCSAGYVLRKGFNEYGMYFMDVQNQCSGNVKRFTFNKFDWDRFQVSNVICMNRNSAW